MSLQLNPPPLQVPPQLTQDKFSAAFFEGLIRVLYQLWTSVYSIRLSAQAKTTDATLTPAIRIPVKEGQTIMVDARVVARRESGSAGAIGDSAWYVVQGAYKMINGVLSGIGSPTIYGQEDRAAWDVQLSFFLDQALIMVKGEANMNITWECTVSTYVVSA